MKTKQSFKIGDKIVHFGRIHKIFKTEEEEDSRGRVEKIIYFKPYFKTKDKRSLICSIPVANIDKTGIRKPISKQRLAKLLRACAKKTKFQKPINISRAKKILETDELARIVWVLRSLWREKNDESINFTKSRRDVLKNAVNRLKEEVAFVSGLSLRESRKKIKQALKKGVSQQV